MIPKGRHCDILPGALALRPRIAAGYCFEGHHQTQDRPLAVGCRRWQRRRWRRRRQCSLRQHGSVVVTIMRGGCVSEAKGKTERVRGTKAREREDEGGWVEQGRDGRRVPRWMAKREKSRGSEKGECGKTCSLSLHPFPPTDHPVAAARSKRGGRGGGGRGRTGRTGVGQGVVSRRKKGVLGLPRGARRRERGCRTPIRSIAAYSPYTFTTSLEFSALCLFFLTSFKISPEKDISVTRRMHTILRFRPVAVRTLFPGLWSVFLSGVIEHNSLRRCLLQI